MTILKSVNSFKSNSNDRDSCELKNVTSAVSEQDESRERIIH